MHWRKATDDDLDLLAEWNRQLIAYEGHRNPMTVSELRNRMSAWLSRSYRAVIFSGDEDLAYALYRETETEIHLRQFFVRRDRRRQGIGRAAMHLLLTGIWPATKRRTVDVLTANSDAVAFWRAVGYRDYCLTLEMGPYEKRRE